VKTHFHLLIIRVSGTLAARFTQHFPFLKEFAQCALYSVDAIEALTTPRNKMADGVDIDLYADDIEQDFAQVLCIYLKTHDNLVVYVSV